MKELYRFRQFLTESVIKENTEEEIKAILSKSYPGAYSEDDFEEIINLYNTKYKDYKDSYGKLDGVEQAAFKFNYANNRDIMTGMKAGSKSSTSITFPEMEDEFEGAMSSMSVSKEEYLQDIINASADEIVSDSYFEIKNAVEQEIYSKNEAVELAKAWAKEKLSTLSEGLFSKKPKLSSSEYQKAKKLKGFDPKNYEWDKNQKLYLMKESNTLKEGHGLSQHDLDYLEGLADRTDNEKLKKIIKLLAKTNIKN
jgi:hypothetical protein